MTAEQWQHVKTLFEEALEQPRATRMSWVDEHCPEESIRNEVRSLLAAQSEGADFLESPPEAGPELLAALEPGSMVGERVGSWKLVEEIGQGGMGTVYRAVRADDEFRREVAIKIVSRGMDTHLLLRRFRTERQILANLEHPYIARLLDGGSTPSGLPYFVMEYVKGVPLTVYCDRNRLGVTDRIQLFRKVCSAVAYAHSNLIVHRDLKPANILVTADGTPKLLDFGIARILSGPGRESSEPTVTMLRMATPAYASPEQIRGSVAGIPSDIYSLGVILYELLTGHRPYRLPSRDSSELARVICEREPTRPSVVVGFSETVERGGDLAVLDAAGICHDRDTTLEQLRRKLRGDLDNILSMALRKEPHRRYESVDQFSDDLQRTLAGLPIIARKDTLTYRAVKFIDRHRWGVMATAVAILTLSLISVVAISKAARLSRRLAEDHRLATAVLVNMYEQVASLPGTMPVRESILQESLRYINGLASDAGDEPDVQRSLALAWEKFAELQGGRARAALGRSGEAMQTVARARAIREALVKGRPSDSALQLELARNYLLSATVAGRATSLDVRRGFEQKAVAILDKLVRQDSRRPEYRAALARGQMSLGQTLIIEEKTDEARVHLRHALAIYNEMAAEAPEDFSVHRSAAQVRYEIGNSYAVAGQPSHAQQEYLAALAIQERLLEGQPDNNNVRGDIASIHHFLAISLEQMKEYPKALGHVDQAIAIRKIVLEQDPRDSNMRTMLAGNHAVRANVLMAMRDFREAIRSARLAVQFQKDAVEADRMGVPVRISLADFEGKLARAYLGLAESGKDHGAWREAAEWFRRSLEHWDELNREGHLRFPSIQTELAQLRAALARCLAALGGAA